VSTRGRRDRERGERLARILDAAEQVFAAQGPAAASMDAVAEAAELSKGSLYYYFESKQALQDAVMLRGVRRLFDQVLGQLEPEGTLLAAVTALLRGFVAFFEVERDLLAIFYPLMIAGLRGAARGGRAAAAAELPPYLASAWQGHERLLAELELRMARVPSGLSPTALTNLLMDLLLGLGARMLAGGGRSPSEEVDAFLLLLERGLAAPGERHVPPLD